MMKRRLVTAHKPAENGRRLLKILEQNPQRASEPGLRERLARAIASLKAKVADAA
jgi:hypothetical protein